MGKLSKNIIDGLRADKVDAAEIERVRPLIDGEAEDFDPERAAEVEIVVRYICDVTQEAPKVTQDFKTNRASNLVDGLSRNLTLDRWDERALDVIEQSKGEYWFWEVDSWVDDRSELYPAEPILEQTIEMFRRRKLWNTDADVLDAVLSQVNSYVTKDGALTSSGRWILSRIEQDLESVLAAAQKLKRTSHLFPLLIRHRPALFDELLPKFASQDVHARTLAELLLETNAERYEVQVLRLVENHARGDAFFSARDLERFLPGKHPEVVKKLLLSALTTDMEILIVDDACTNSHAGAYAMAWPALGKEGAKEIWNAYKEKNDALRLRFYETIEAQGKAFALPWLINGLVYPKGKTEYGFVTHAKYVTKMLQILKPYDLSPYRTRIEKKFAGNKSEKIKEEIAKAFGGKTKKSAAKGKVRASFQAKNGYRFDVYVDAVVKALFKGAMAKKKKIPQPVTLIQLAGDSEHFQLNVLVLEGEGETLEVKVVPPKGTKVPEHVDDADGRPLSQFAKIHGLEDDDERPRWGDLFKLPACVLIHEQIAGVRALAKMFAEAGIKVAPRCKIGVGAHDSFWNSGFDKMAREEISALPQSQQADFAAVCFESPAKQRWLLKGK